MPCVDSRVAMEENRRVKRDRLLLVGEELYTIFLLMTYLESCNYEVASARNGHDALEFVQVEKPDLILFCEDDIAMLDGYTFLKSIRGVPQTFRTPVILLSSRNQTIEQAKCLNHKVDAYMVKPFELEKLEAQVKRLINYQLSFA